MDVEILAFCDAATQAGNKINIVGVFDQIESVRLPAQISCSVGARIRFDLPEIGKKKLDVSLIGPDGNQLFNASGDVEIREKSGENYAALQVVLNLPIVRLPQFGDYELRLAIDGTVLKTIPLHVRSH